MRRRNELSVALGALIFLLVLIFCKYRYHWGDIYNPTVMAKSGIISAPIFDSAVKNDFGANMHDSILIVTAFGKISSDTQRPSSPYKATNISDVTPNRYMIGYQIKHTSSFDIGTVYITSNNLCSQKMIYSEILALHPEWQKDSANLILISLYVFKNEREFQKFIK